MNNLKHFFVGFNHEVIRPFFRIKDSPFYEYLLEMVIFLWTWLLVSKLIFDKLSPDMSPELYYYGNVSLRHMKPGDVMTDIGLAAFFSTLIGLAVTTTICATIYYSIKAIINFTKHCTKIGKLIKRQKQ